MQLNKCFGCKSSKKVFPLTRNSQGLSSYGALKYALILRGTRNYCSQDLAPQMPFETMNFNAVNITSLESLHHYEIDF